MCVGPGFSCRRYLGSASPWTQSSQIGRRRAITQTSSFVLLPSWYDRSAAVMTETCGSGVVSDAESYAQRLYGHCDRLNVAGKIVRTGHALCREPPPQQRRTCISWNCGNGTWLFRLWGIFLLTGTILINVRHEKCPSGRKRTVTSELTHVPLPMRSPDRGTFRAAVCVPCRQPQEPRDLR